MEPIKACGHVRKEPVVDVGERNTIAAKMGAEGITSTPEYIAMIDKQVADGVLQDKVADFVRKVVADGIVAATGYFPMFVVAVRQVFQELVTETNSLCFKKLLTQQKQFDDAVAVLEKLSSKYPQAIIELNEKERHEVNTILEGMHLPSSIDRTEKIEAELDQFIKVFRSSVLDIMGCQSQEDEDDENKTGHSAEHFIERVLNTPLPDCGGRSTKMTMEEALDAFKGDCKFKQDDEKAIPVTDHDQFMEWSRQEDLRMIDRMRSSTEDEIQTAIRVIQRIGYGAAYGRNPKLCEASNEVWRALNPEDPDIADQVLKKYEK